MIKVIDGFLVRLEFNQKELCAIPYRGFLYAGIGLMAVLAPTFAGLTIANLV